MNSRFFLDEGEEIKLMADVSSKIDCSILTLFVDRQFDSVL